jgi:hypothetical protein
MITKCLNWIESSTARADEYYRAMTKWATSRRTDGSVKQLVRLATAYDKALDRALRCLQKLQKKEPVDKQIEQTKRYKSLIKADLQLLSDMKE